uniref:Uncharacterized protein n=1 Tax=uncultured gamma proteobacterium HF0010_01E20 TaxID=710977 RepID=E0XQ86_9GAMM|nr:hypothetical protein [uncultured gamma proteobacterium HF0010_01E20]
MVRNVLTERRTGDRAVAKHERILRHLSRKNFVYPHHYRIVLNRSILYIR